MSKKNVCFSVNSFDYEGDIHEEGIYLHFGDTRVLVAGDVKEYKSFCNKLVGMTEEINETFERTNY